MQFNYMTLYHHAKPTAERDRGRKKEREIEKERETERTKSIKALTSSTTFQ